jgi:hypothetical protein
MTKRIRQLYRNAGLKPPDGKGIHTTAFHKCVVKVTKAGTAKNPHAVCMKSLGRNKAVKKSHRR